MKFTTKCRVRATDPVHPDIVEKGIRTEIDITGVVVVGIVTMILIETPITPIEATDPTIKVPILTMMKVMGEWTGDNRSGGTCPQNLRPETMVAWTLKNTGEIGEMKETSVNLGPISEANNVITVVGAVAVVAMAMMVMVQIEIESTATEAVGVGVAEVGGL